MPVSKKKIGELAKPNAVKSDAWVNAKIKKETRGAVGRPIATRNQEGYFTTIFAHHSDPYQDPAKIERQFQRSARSGGTSSMKVALEKKMPGQAFDTFQSLHQGDVYVDPFRRRMAAKKEQRDRCLKLAPRNQPNRPAFKSGGGYKKPTQFDPPVFLQEVDSKTAKSQMDAVVKEIKKLEDERRIQLREPKPRNVLVASAPSGGYGVAGQMIGRANISYATDPYERKETLSREEAKRLAEKQKAVHGNTVWANVPLRNPNSSLVTVGVFGKDTDVFGLDAGTKKKLDQIAEMRAQPRVLTLPDWLTQYRLIKFQDVLATEGNLKKPVDVHNMTEDNLQKLGKLVGMRGPERQRLANMKEAIANVINGKGTGIQHPEWKPSHPGKAGGNSLIDPKATFTPYPGYEKPKKLSQNIVRRQKRMYAVLPEFQEMQWNGAAAPPLEKHTPSVAMKEFSGVQRTAIACSKVGRFGPAVVRGGPHFASKAAHDTRLSSRPF